MKYIMLRIKIGSLDQKLPVIFPNNLCHIDVAAVIVTMLCAKKYAKAEDLALLSAGDIQFSDVVTSGHSTTLKIEASEDDASVIEFYDYLHGLS